MRGGIINALALLLALTVFCNGVSSLWVPPLNTWEGFESRQYEDLNDAFHFEEKTEYQGYYGTLYDVPQYFTFDVSHPRERIQITLWRSSRPDEDEFFPGLVLMGPNRLNIDKSGQSEEGLPNEVIIPQGYDTFVKYDNEKGDLVGEFEGLIPFSWYRVSLLNFTDELAPGTYAIAVFSYGIEGHYALAVGYEEVLTFGDFMVGPFDAIFTYWWLGFHPGLSILPILLTLLVGLVIMSYQTCFRRNSPLTWYSWFVMVGGFLIMGQTNVVLMQVTYSLLAISHEEGSDTAWKTALFAIMPVFCGFLLILAGLKRPANILIRLCVAFLAIGSTLAWACYYVGPFIAFVGVFLPPYRRKDSHPGIIPFHRCFPCCVDKFIDEVDDEGIDDTAVYDDVDELDKQYEEEAAAKAAAAEAGNRGDGDSDDDNERGDGEVGDPEVIAMQEMDGHVADDSDDSTADEKPFSDTGGVVIVADEDEDEDEASPAVASSSSQPPVERDDI
jgi:hypothetical protein